MNAVPFDTLQFANRLKTVGFSEEQAAVITDLQRAASNNTLEQAQHDYHLNEVATKRDLQDMENTLRHDMREIEHRIEILRAETNQRVAEVKADLTRWIVAAGFLQTTLIIGVLLKVGRLL